jgi:phage terminase small subunit
MPKKLTNRQRRFALAYAADPQHNGTKAALAAGCPKASAHVMASRWLKNADVQDHVEQFLGRIAQKYELSAEKVIQELCKHPGLASAREADRSDALAARIASLRDVGAVLFEQCALASS